jgi:hypothetical protein
LPLSPSELKGLSLNLAAALSRWNIIYGGNVKLDKIIVSLDSFNSPEPYDIIDSNNSVVNLLREEGAAESDICAQARISYARSQFTLSSHQKTTSTIFSTIYYTTLRDFTDKVM